MQNCIKLSAAFMSYQQCTRFQTTLDPDRRDRHTLIQHILKQWTVWLSRVVVSALGMRTRRPRLESQVVPLFHWVATLGKLFTHIASPVSQLQETGYKREFSEPKWLW